MSNTFFQHVGTAPRDQFIVRPSGISRVCAHLIRCHDCVHVSVLLVPPCDSNSPFGICSTISHWVWGFTAGQGLELYFPGIILCCVDNLQFQGFGPKPVHSVCISWYIYGRQLITIISDLVPSKKQISGIGATRLIGGASSSKGPSIYDVHAEGEGGQAHVDGGGGFSPRGRPHRKIKLESFDIILSSSHSKKSVYF